MSKLNAKQQEFVRQYLLLRNATQAARKAGYAENGIEVHAHRLLRNPNISAAIAAQEKKVIEKFEITQEKIIESLAAIAFFNPLDAMTWKHGDGTHGSGKVVWKDSEAIDRRVAAAMDVWGSPSGKSVSFRNSDRTKALELLGKHVGMWKDGQSAGQQSDSNARKDAIARISKHLARRKGSGSSDGTGQT